MEGATRIVSRDLAVTDGNHEACIVSTENMLRTEDDELPRRSPRRGELASSVWVTGG